MSVQQGGEDQGYTRTIGAAPAVVQADTPAVDGVERDLMSWLHPLGRDYSVRWLLAHADDGVIWGRWTEDGVDVLGTRLEGRDPMYRSDFSYPELRASTLQTLRAFGPSAEVLLWRDGDGAWRARLVRDAREGEKARFAEAFDEEQILWGTKGKPIGDGMFVEMSDGAQGLRHAVPLPGAAGDHGTNVRPLRLCVRHYVAEDKDPSWERQGTGTGAGDGTPGESGPRAMPGFTRVVLSRLCDLRIDESAKREGCS